jgi:hypothetical protein
VSERPNLLHKPVEVTHACPNCQFNNPRPLCPICLGAGLVSDERLARLQFQQKYGQ